MKTRKKSTWQRCKVCFDWSRRDSIRNGMCQTCSRDWLSRRA